MTNPRGRGKAKQNLKPNPHPVAPYAGTDTHDPYTNVAYNLGFRVMDYELALDYRVGPNRLDGTAQIRLETYQELTFFTLDLASTLTVSGVTAQLIGSRTRTSIVKRYRHADNKLTVTLREPVEPDAVIVLTINYHGTPRPIASTWGELGWEELTNGSLVASQPCGARSWFPCDDTPDQKAPIRLTITVDNPYTVVATGRRTDHTRKGSRTTWAYELAHPTATYLVSVLTGVFGEYDLRALPSSVNAVPEPHADSSATGVHVPSSGGTSRPAAPATEGWTRLSLATNPAHTTETRVTAYCPPALRANVTLDFGLQAQMVDYFTSVFGAYPWDDYRVVITEDDLEIPLEAAGLSIFGANHADGNGTWERLIAHELVHQWCGNSVGINEWKHIWVNEGMACYGEWLWEDYRGGNSAATTAKRHYDRLTQLPQDILLANPGPQDMFDDRIYKRGALTVHALRVALGEEAFFSALRNWGEDNRHSIVTNTDFRQCFVSAGERCGVEDAATKVRAVWDAWVVNTSLPEFPA